MRLFLTINMSPTVRDEIANLIPRLRANYQKGRWVPKDNLHITMLFLGEVEENKLTEINNVLDESIIGISPFKLWIEGIGGFPNNKKANILWAGVKGEIDNLNQLYQQVIENISKTELSFDAKSEYTPHVTLARKVFESVSNDFSLKTDEWTVDSLELYQSVFKDRGVMYKKIISKTF